MLWRMWLHICVKVKGGFTLHRYQISTQQWQSKYIKLLRHWNDWIILLLCLSTPAGAQAADDTPPLRPILCLALCFAPAQFHASQLLLNCPLPCVLWCLDNLEGVHLKAFFVILLPAFLIVCPIQVHFLWLIIVSMESCSAMFHNSLLVILSFQLMLKVVELWCEKKLCSTWKSLFTNFYKYDVIIMSMTVYI